ncbi:hypothetical protein Tco_0149349 [Tanacetum coccineum]
MEDPNITMEEYIRLEEEKARRNGKVYNWETATYGRIWHDDEVHNLISVETEFPAIVFDDTISFDESDDEDYTVIFDKKSFSYKIISVNNLKTDSENDNDKINMPSFSSPETMVSYSNDLDFLKDFEKEFPAISYNDSLTEPTVSPQHIDEFDLQDETSLSEYDEEEQNVLYFNDIFPFNIIYPDDLKSDKENDDNEIDIIQSSGDMALPPRDQRHQFLRFEGLRYTDADITDFEERFGRIYGREIHRVQVFDFEGLTELMAEGLSGRMLMEHRDAQGQSAVLDLDIAGALQFQLGGVRRRMSWRVFILGILSARDFLSTAPSYTLIRDPMLRLCHRLIACSIAGRSQAPEKVTVTDLFYLRGMDVGSVNIHYLLVRYLRLFASGRMCGVMISEDLPVINMAELVRLQICKELDDTWAWIALRLGRQQTIAADAPEVTEGAPDVDEGDQDVLAPVQAPQPPTGGPARTMTQRLGRHRTDDASTSAPQQPDP